MDPHELNTLHIIHVLAVLGLTGATFYAFAGAPESRKRVLMWSGIASLLVLLTGVRMWQAQYHFHGGWVVVKIVCWLGLSAISGIAYRRRGATRLLMLITLALLATALAMVYVRPF
ncbi:MAG TPA: hypothetical protein VNW23_09215 [Opitutaceae bacterium]|jgi:hypothetical protein|nr:hypothetical protein [Opitutaceae bacterium]HXA15292.1 hypothetical protein [Opitutaceae bacterium]